MKELLAKTAPNVGVKIRLSVRIKHEKHFEMSKKYILGELYKFYVIRFKDIIFFLILSNWFKIYFVGNKLKPSALGIATLFI